MKLPSIYRVCLLACIALLAVPVVAQVKPPPGRTAKDITLQLGDVGREIDGLGSNPAVILANSAAKPEHAAKVIAALKKRHGLYSELLRATVPPPPPGTYAFDIIWGDALLYALHDDETVKAVDAGAKAQRTDAKLTLAVGTWYLAASKPEEQMKILESLRPLAKSYPADETLGRVMTYLQGTLPAKPEVAAAVEDIIVKHLRSPSALHFKNMPRVGKAFSVAGTLLDGAAFSSSKFKGKIVLVHFWSPEQGPSRAEITALKKLFDENNSKGLEIVGVISQATAAEATRYLTDSKAPWPEIFDPHLAPTQYHGLLSPCDVDENNVVLVIDRAANYRTRFAREHLSELDTFIPKLLAEKTATTSTAPATTSAPATQLFH